MPFQTYTNISTFIPSLWCLTTDTFAIKIMHSIQANTLLTSRNTVSLTWALKFTNSTNTLIPLIADTSLIDWVGVFWTGTISIYSDESRSTDTNLLVWVKYLVCFARCALLAIQEKRRVADTGFGCWIIWRVWRTTGAYPFEEIVIIVTCTSFPIPKAIWLTFYAFSRTNPKISWETNTSISFKGLTWPTV